MIVPVSTPGYGGDPGSIVVMVKLLDVSLCTLRCFSGSPDVGGGGPAGNQLTASLNIGSRLLFRRSVRCNSLSRSVNICTSNNSMIQDER